MTRIKMAVYVNLDNVPGAMYTAESAQNILRGTLDRTLHAYNPMVSIESYDTSKASEPRPNRVYRTKNGEPAPEDTIVGDIWQIEGHAMELIELEDGELIWNPLNSHLARPVEHEEIDPDKITWAENTFKLENGQLFRFDGSEWAESSYEELFSVEDEISRVLDTPFPQTDPATWGGTR